MEGIDGKDDISDSESLGEIMTTDNYDHFKKIPLQERVKRGQKRARQQMAYTRLMEDRMADLEKRMRKIEKNPELAAPVPGLANGPANLILGLKRMSFQEYLPTDPNPGFKTSPGVSEDIEHKCRHEFPGQLPYHLIDVVVSATHQLERLGKSQSTKPAAGPPDLAASSLVIQDQDPMTTDGQFVQPDRIRINSTLLLESLHTLTGLAFTRAYIGNGFGLQDQVILRPFKLLVTFEKEIREEITRLENMHMDLGNECKARAPEAAKSGDQNPPSRTITDSLHKLPEPSSQDHAVGLEDNKSQHTTINASVDGENEGIPPLKSMRCLEELRVLRELLDKDLKPTFDLRKQIKEGVARSIAFQDLWHLFSHGDEIVSNDSNGQNQMYRILSVSGGRPFLCDSIQAGMDQVEPSSNGRSLPNFEILSYFYDSDGKELGACQQLHTIKSYDGIKAITSLPCFPIIYSKIARGLKPREFFVERGRRFIELTRKTDVMHKRYDGLTLAMDELREEVRPSWNIMQATD